MGNMQKWLAKTSKLELLPFTKNILTFFLFLARLVPMKRLVILIVSAILSFSCVSKETAAQPEPAPEVPAVKEEATHIDETPPPAKPEPQKSPKPEEPREAEPEPAFEVTREVYNQTFDEMRVLINKLNKIIADKKNL